MFINKLFHPTPFAFSILDAVGIGHKKPRAPIGNGSANRPHASMTMPESQSKFGRGSSHEEIKTHPGATGAISGSAR